MRPALVSILLVSVASVIASATPPCFTVQVVDDTMAGDCKMAGDVDQDGLLDLIVGGSIGEGLCWYRFPTWRKTLIARPNDQFTTDGAVGDVDRDGDPDIVVPDGNQGVNLVWFRNPGPVGDPGVAGQWERVPVAALDDWGKDVELADFDRDGRMDIAVRTPGSVRVFFQDEGEAWSSVMVADRLQGEGMCSGDVDSDGDVDLALAGVWLDNPSERGDARGLAWEAHVIDGSMYRDVKGVVADINADGHRDIVYSCSEGVGDVAWYSPDAGDPRGTWSKHVVVPGLYRGHTLQVADMDGGGGLDIIVGQMHTTNERVLAIYLNSGGVDPSWTMLPVADTGLHSGVVADFAASGHPGIFGCNWTGHPPVRYWVNHPSGCPGDVDDGRMIGAPDGAVEINDLLYFIRAYESGGAGADLDDGTSTGTPDGGVDANDLLYFIASYHGGC